MLVVLDFIATLFSAEAEVDPGPDRKYHATRIPPKITRHVVIIAQIPAPDMVFILIKYISIDTIDL